MAADPLVRLRALCLALPDAHEVKTWGEPTFRVKNKLFAMYAGPHNHHGQGRSGVWIKAGPGVQEMLVRAAPDRFFVPAYVGPSGWVGVWLDRRPRWKELADLLRDGYALAAPRKPAAREGRTVDGKTKAAADRSASTPERQLESFIAKYTPEIADLARRCFASLRKRLPTATVLVYDNYNALAVGFAPGEKTSEAILSLTPYPKWVTLFFLQGQGLPDPEGALRGSGKLARSIVLDSPARLKDAAVRTLIDEALNRAKVPLPATGKGRIVIKSISAKQRPRRPA